MLHCVSWVNVKHVPRSTAAQFPKVGDLSRSCYVVAFLGKVRVFLVVHSDEFSILFNDMVHGV